jgi:hypothetical protein
VKSLRPAFWLGCLIVGGVLTCSLFRLDTLAFLGSAATSMPDIAARTQAFIDLERRAALAPEAAVLIDAGCDAAHLYDDALHRELLALLDAELADAGHSMLRVKCVTKGTQPTCERVLDLVDTATVRPVRQLSAVVTSFETAPPREVRCSRERDAGTPP